MFTRRGVVRLDTRVHAECQRLGTNGEECEVALELAGECRKMYGGAKSMDSRYVEVWMSMVLGSSRTDRV